MLTIRKYVDLRARDVSIDAYEYRDHYGKCREMLLICLFGRSILLYIISKAKIDYYSMII